MLINQIAAMLDQKNVPYVYRVKDFQYRNQMTDQKHERYKEYRKQSQVQITIFFEDFFMSHGIKGQSQIRISNMLDNPTMIEMIGIGNDHFTLGTDSQKVVWTEIQKHIKSYKKKGIEIADSMADLNQIEEAVSWS